MVLENISSEKTNAALETWLSESKERSDAAFTEMATHSDRLRSEMNCLSYDWSTIRVMLQMVHCEMRAIRSDMGTISGQLIEHKAEEECRAQVDERTVGAG